MEDVARAFERDRFPGNLALFLAAVGREHRVSVKLRRAGRAVGELPGTLLVGALHVMRSGHRGQPAVDQPPLLLGGYFSPGRQVAVEVGQLGVLLLDVLLAGDVVDLPVDHEERDGRIAQRHVGVGVGFFPCQRVEPGAVDRLAHLRVPDPPVPRGADGERSDARMRVAHPGGERARELHEIRPAAGAFQIRPSDQRLHH